MGTVYAKEGNRLSDGVKSRQPDSQPVKLDGIKARVDKISIDGLQRTQEDIVFDTVKDIFKAKDFQDVIVRSHQARGKLETLGCFRNIGIFIDVSSGAEATASGVEVIFHVQEQKRIVGGVNTVVGNNEGSLVLGMRMPNILGRGEKLQTEYSYGSKKTSNINVTLSKPFIGESKPVVSLSMFQQGSEWPWSGYKQIERGLLYDIAFHSLSNVKHNLQWEASWREVGSLSKSGSMDVREQSGHTLKSALKHILTVDTRNNAIFPTGGVLVQNTSEYAGLGGNVSFVKNEAIFQANVALFQDVVLQLGVQGGILYARQGVNLCDQFYLGGPLTVRGYQMRGLGPHVDGNAMGCNTYVASGVHLFAPLPFRPGKGGLGDIFRTHIFFTCGNSADSESDWRKLGDDMRASYGMGLAMRLGQMARLELNYCIPLRPRDGDLTSPGWQFGVGCHFL